MVKDLRVEINWAAIARRLETASGQGFIVFRPSSASTWSIESDPSALEAVDAARVYANASVERESTESFDTSPSPHGPIVYLNDPGTEQSAHAWITAFAAHLTAAGRTGLVDLATEWVHEPDWIESMRNAPKFTIFEAHALDQELVQRHDRSASPGWSVEPEATSVLCRDRASWCSGVDDPEVYLTQFMSNVRFLGSEVARPLAASISLDYPSGVTFANPLTGEVRHTNLSYKGEVTSQVHHSGKDWRNELDQARNILAYGTSVPDLALIRIVSTWARDWSSLHIGPSVLPFVTASDFQRNRHLWNRYAPDAHGVQVLTDAHLEQALRLDDWDIQTLAPGRHLVQARDLAPWYTGPTPDPDVLAAARNDFGGMILTPEIIEHHPRT